MIDKLKLTGSEQIAGSLSITNLKAEIIMDAHYNRCEIFRRDQKHLLTVKTKPRLSHISPVCIELNPSNFSSLDQLLDFISDFYEPSFLKIKRIDHCVDIPIAISQLHSMVKVPRKMKRSDFQYSDELTGFDIGRGHEVFVFYNKGFERISSRKYRDLKNGLTHLSRIEVRHTKNKIQHENLLNLAAYKLINPFEKIEFYNLREDCMENKKAKAFQTLCATNGLQSLYKRLNQNSNFQRTYGKFLEESNLGQLIHEQYLESLSNFIEGK